MSETANFPATIVAELEQKLADRDRALAELRRAAALHVMEAERLHGALKERDAYIEELEAAARDQANMAEKLIVSQQARTESENELRQVRGRLAQAEGDLLRMSRNPSPTPEAAPQPTTPSVEALTQEIEKLKRALESANAENWKIMKARSDAEAQAAEVREDTVRKLRDARKLATVELTRAMEEATKKAVGLKEELARSETERKKLATEKKELALAVEAAGKNGDPASDSDRQNVQAERDDFELRYTLGIKTIQRLNSEIAHLRTRLQELIDTVDRSKTPAAGHTIPSDLTRL